MQYDVSAMDLWRISPCADWQEAARRPRTARWHTRGPDVLYTSTSDALALVEALAHLAEHPVGHRYLRLRIANARAAIVSRASLPDDWTRSRSITRRIGDAWLRSGETPLLCVPSVHGIEAMNVLVNPAHPDFDGLSVIDAGPFRFNSRLRRAAPAHGGGRRAVRRGHARDQA